MKELQISKRLKAVAEFVGKGLVLADVGSDHGFIPIYLIQKNQIARAIAMDVNQGPLLRADSHIREWGLESYIETRLSDGVKALKPGEVQSVVIAGMGGPLMEKIILEGTEVFAQVQELILQPQSEIGAFRRFLGEQGYCIEDVKSCYQNCLALAAAQGCRSVAFPSISTGVYRFPLERAAAIAVAAIKEGLEAHPQLEKVMMVCFDNATKAAYEKALQNRSR